MKQLTTVLIANRGEIALRIQAACHARGLRTIAVFAPEDKQLRYVAQASAAYPLSGSGFSAYLNQEELIAIARLAGADAVHPGYGFLAENAVFAQRVTDAGLTWIGPAAHVIAAMASKEQARKIAQRAGVSVLPASVVLDLSSAGASAAAQAAERIGYPVIIKDPLGGGGKGMRRVLAPQDFPAAWEQVVVEATKQTKTTSLIIEKYILAGRHIEVQIAGDGNAVVHLFERECSLQRRHQKIIEEAPALFISDATKQELYAAACRLARMVQYDSIGTVEFVVAPDESWYFLEMNTRLQVEHGVTELTTGLDLVDLQLTLAQTEHLPLQQESIRQHGHAIQCRLYAEDPEHNFMPAAGTIQLLALPQHPFLRIEHDLHAGAVVSPFFDPMIAKFITFGPTRAYAQQVMQYALAHACFHGLTTNALFLRNLLAAPFFAQGAFHTQLLADRDLVRTLAADLPLEHVEGEANAAELQLAGLAVALLGYAQGQEKSQHESLPGAQQRRWKEQQWW